MKIEKEKLLCKFLFSLSWFVDILHHVSIPRKTGKSFLAAATFLEVLKLFTKELDLEVGCIGSRLCSYKGYFGALRSRRRFAMQSGKPRIS